MHSPSLTRILALSSAVCLASTLTAQVPPNDDCNNAVIITLGVGTTTIAGINTTAATTSSVWPCANGGTDVWYLYVPQVTGTATVETCSLNTTFDSALQVLDGTNGCAALASINCNDDSCSLQSSITWTAVANTPYYIRLGGFGGASGTADLILTQEADFRLVAAAETTPLSGPLLANGGSIRDNDILRFNFDDPNGLYIGNIAVNTINLGTGVQPNGVTPGIPDFYVLHTGSSPAGFAFIMPIQTIGGADFLLPIAPGVLQANGDSIRMQGLVLDLAASPLPVTPTDNQMHFYLTDCLVQEEFEDLPPQAIGFYPNGWSNGPGIRQWTPNTGGTPSGGTGPSGAAQGEGYFYTEASTPAIGGDTFILDSPVWPAANAPTMTLQFELSRLGSAVGVLEVYVGDGTTFPAAPAASYNTNTATDWETQTVTLPAQANYQIRFTYTHGGTFSGDCAIDSVGLK